MEYSNKELYHVISPNSFNISGVIGIPFCPFQSEAMELYLVWDSESEVTKDGTLLETCMRADDESSDDSAPPARKSKKTKKRKRSSSSSGEERFFLGFNAKLQQSTKSLYIDHRCCSLICIIYSTVAFRFILIIFKILLTQESSSKSERSEKSAQKGKAGSEKTKGKAKNKKSKTSKKKPKKETAEARQKREEKEAERQKKKEADKVKREAESKKRKEYNEKVSAAKKVHLACLL